MVCLAPSALGQRFRLYDRYPGPALNRRASAVVVEPNGSVDPEPTEEDLAPVTIVRIDGVIEQRAGYQAECGGYSDGHDAIAERLIAALEETDVLLVVDSPGGAHAGLEQAVARVVRVKEEHARRITVYAEEMIGSAAYWWTACVGDEIFAPPSGIIGSIGARAAHMSEAVALEKMGVAVTYFAWPGPGKVAFAGELPLSDLGRQRGERDTAIAGEAFAAAVGPRRGMTREEIVELDADALSGDLAVNAKLIDGLASYENVLDYCIALAERAQNQENEMDPKKKNVAVSQISASTAAAQISPALRAEDDPEKKDEESEEPEQKEGLQPDGICNSCGHQMRNEAKYCDQCGGSMEAAPLESEEDEEPKEAASEDPEKKDEEPSKPEPAAKFPAAKSTGASFAALLGLRDGASDLAIKTALVRKLQVVDYAATLTGSDREDRMLGQLRAMSEDAKESGRLRASLTKVRQRAEGRERLDLLKSLVAANLPDYPRGNLLVDEIGGNGRVVGIVPAPAYAEIKIETLRGLVRGKLANAAPAARASKSPFTPAEPDPVRAKSATQNHRIEQAKKNPVVVKATRDGIDPNIAAGIYAREFGDK